MHSLRWQSAVDFIVLVFALYALLRWAEQARAFRIVLAIVGLFTGALLARHFDLIITGLVFEAGGLVTILLLLMIFQPELRRDLMRLDRIIRLGLRRSSTLVSGYRTIAEAAFAMANARQGALIVIVRRDPITELVDAGIAFGAEITVPTLEAIFRKDAPLHDGAAIIEEDRISRVNAVLPLTHRSDVPSAWGTRHRAAMGLAERCDAVVITVSEERGDVTVMRGGDCQRIADRNELIRLLDSLQRPAKVRFSARVRSAFVLNWRLKLAATGLASLIWAVFLLETAATVRIVNVPVQFSNVPQGMDISEQSATTLEVQLRGSPWLMDSGSINTLVASFDLRGLRQGWVTLRLAPKDLQLPPGVTLERAFPQALSVHLVARGG